MWPGQFQRLAEQAPLLVDRLDGEQGAAAQLQAFILVVAGSRIVEANLQAFGLRLAKQRGQ